MRLNTKIALFDLLFVSDSESLCCTKTFYSPSSDICCKNAVVSVRDQGCKDANPLYYSGIEA